MASGKVIAIQEFTGAYEEYRARIENHLDSERQAILDGNFEEASKARKAFFDERISKSSCQTNQTGTRDWRTAYKQQIHPNHQNISENAA